MKKSYTLNSTLIVYILILFSFFSINAQEDSKIIDAYEDYTEAPREISYVHLNKSTYIEGEMMGFTAYLFDKYTKEPSTMTSNLYCTISNEKGDVLKKKLIQIKSGIASNIFEIDSTLSTGIFTFKAYTNWMRNFDEHNHFEQTFKVIDADNNAIIKPISNDDIKVDLQVLGEGGHVLYDVPNTIGIIAKNQFGKGISKAFGSIVDNDGNVLSQFQLNKVGIAKTIFTPQTDKTYFTELITNNKTIKTQISNIEVFGLVMTLAQRSKKVTLNIKTNTQTLKQFQNKTLKLALHNGSEMQISEFKLNDQGTATISYPIEMLTTGVNIFTVFNENNKPLLERLYFNTTSLGSNQLIFSGIKTEKDSLNLSLSLNDVDTSKWSALSISVLPSKTKSYNHHNTLISQLYIQPYVKGPLENSRQYFENINSESNYNLDLLMMTQGWSSYDWNAIFNYNNNYPYLFEHGIDIKANINDDKDGTYIVYPLAESNTQLFEIPEQKKEFLVKGAFPNDDDLLRVGHLNTKKKEFGKKPSLYLQFYPSKFPSFNYTNNIINETYVRNDAIMGNVNLIKASKDIEELDEVVISGKRTFTRAESLTNKAINSKVDVMSDNLKLRNQRLDLYIQRLGFNTQFDYFSGTLSITNPRVNWGTNVPMIYLDNILLTTFGNNPDFSPLTFLNTSNIDYIEYELYGVGGGVRGQAGFIKIHTSPDYRKKHLANNVNTYDMPLRFNKEKAFYTPKYQYYNSSFYNDYGTIDWKPNLKLDTNGSINFKVLNTKSKSITLFIEGVVNDVNYVSQKIIIEGNN
jgi:hypothetical protein